MLELEMAIVLVSDQGLRKVSMIYISSLVL